MEIKNKTLTKEKLMKIANDISLDLKIYPISLFKSAMIIELEHGLRRKETNITNDNLLKTGKIVLAHLMEIPDYYERLLKMEQDAEKYWKGKKKPNFGFCL